MSPSEAKSLKDQDLARSILRIQETERVIKDTHMRLAKSQMDFQESLARNRNQWATEEEEHSKRTKEIQDEIEKLEAKKSNALIPINILKDAVTSDMKDAEIFLKSLRERESNADILTEKLEDKLDEVGEREQTVKRQESALTLKIQGVDRQREIITESSEKLTQEISNFAVKMDLAEKDINERKTAVIFKERSLEAIDQTQKRTAKALLDKETRLADERGVLDRAWQEYRRMSGKS